MLTASPYSFGIQVIGAQQQGGRGVLAQRLGKGLLALTDVRKQASLYEGASE